MCWLVSMHVTFQEPKQGNPAEKPVDKSAKESAASSTEEVIAIAKASIAELKGVVKLEDKSVDVEAVGPVYTFGEPGYQIASGTLWLWKTKDSARPEAIMSLATISATRCYEFHSFSVNNLQFDVLGRKWSPEPAWDPKEIPNAPEPGESEQRRLTQMKKLVERFRSKEYVPQLNVTHEMRILPTPIYRYPNSTKQCDGAVFVIGRDGDPEATLMLEAINGKWHFFATRLSSHLPTVYLDEVEYKLDNPPGPFRPYFYTFRPAAKTESPFKQ